MEKPYRSCRVGSESVTSKMGDVGSESVKRGPLWLSVQLGSVAEEETEAICDSSYIGLYRQSTVAPSIDEITGVILSFGQMT